MTANPSQPDIIILGTGIAGTILGAILARLGVNVLLIERGQHPRFTIGESTTPETSMWLRLLAARYGLPELAHVGPFQNVLKHLSTQHGVKRHFGFVYHRPGEEQRPAETTQSIIPDFPFGPESHVMRAEVDNYLLNLAIQKGCTYRSGVAVRAVREKPDGMEVELEGETLRAPFVVDAGGMNSPLAQAFGLRETPTRFQTHSRTLYTHMIGVKAYDAVAPAPGRHDMPRWWAEGTLHHIFKGGWIWVIPFDNHKWSTSPLCSVGMQLDPRIHPATDRAPDDEFRDVLQRYPTVARQFADARAVRGWNTAGRLQYSSTRSSGGRWFLLAHAYAFVDPLFSRGLTNTLETIHSLVPRICAALREGSFPAERFGELEFQQRDMFDNNDQLVAHSYRSFRSFETWNAWNRVWTLGIFYGAARLVRAYNMFKAHGDPQFIDALDTPLVHRTLAPTLPMFEPIFQQSMQLIRDADEERIPTAEAASRIFAMLGSLDICPPPFRLDDPDAILTDFRMPVLLQILRWAKTQAPAVVRDTFFDFPSQGVAKEIGKRLLSRHLMTGKGTLHMHQLGDGDLPSHLLTPELRPHG